METSYRELRDGDGPLSGYTICGAFSVLAPEYKRAKAVEASVAPLFLLHKALLLAVTAGLLSPHGRYLASFRGGVAGLSLFQRTSETPLPYPEYAPPMRRYSTSDSSAPKGACYFSRLSCSTALNLN